MSFQRGLHCGRESVAGRCQAGLLGDEDGESAALPLVVWSPVNGLWFGENSDGVFSFYSLFFFFFSGMLFRWLLVCWLRDWVCWCSGSGSITLVPTTSRSIFRCNHFVVRVGQRSSLSSEKKEACRFGATLFLGMRI